MKQAVVIVHGIGEQIPMGTLEGFVETVWTKHHDLVSRLKPDQNTGKKIRESDDDNASWGKPDERTRSFEVRRITTELDDNKNRTDFYEFYWAHHMQGTTWEHVQGWIGGLLFRNPSTRVPPRLRSAWITLWAMTLIGISVVAWSMLPSDSSSRSPLEVVFWGLAGIVAAAFVSNIVLKRFGDVARYVSATPQNVHHRQRIRESGVEFLQTLIDSKIEAKDGKETRKEYFRIIVVGHSLGSIIAYDILSQLFARKVRTFDTDKPQPEREKLESMIRNAAGLPDSDGTTGGDGHDLDVEAYQAQQTLTWEEAQRAGAQWPITDFVTIGSPLAHADLLLAEDQKAMRDKQFRRILPTCPPVLEHDHTTKLWHFTYSNTPQRTPSSPRRPHHGAMFAYTRWTNLYSDHAGLLLGDIISGRVGTVFGLEVNDKERVRVLTGAKDIAVLPDMDIENERVAEGMRRPFLTYTKYWDMNIRAEKSKVEVPHHIKMLREALGLQVKEASSIQPPERAK